ncbi:AI-2E family transporter [Desulfogranum marinum]|uniref:AI-2E family transporter n=1 Tax=Desulfogranum marinum TaxID=453220 RepID=UPI001966BE6E|nr:AI-2E family transporter [Desulfogranum marinum]MBM9513638.1 AI-2E family transporter [Desulfogranum marinum]
MKKERINKLVLLVLVAGISLLFLSMIKQFLMPLFMAGLFCAMSSPMHRWLSRKLNNRQHMASVMMICGIVALVLVPLSLLIGVVVAQAVSVSQSITPWVQSFINEPGQLAGYMENIPYYEHIVVYRDVIIEKAGELVGNISSFLIDSLSSVTKLTVNAVFSSIIMLYAMFYFFTSGEILLERILYFLPLQDRDERVLLMRFTSVASATIKGTLIIGILQGSICGIAFAVAGIHGPVFWGTVMAVMSIIPAFGTAIVWLPALIILALSGNYVGVVVLLVLCGAVAGNLDNVVRPRLVGKDTQMHDLFVLFGTLGGISMFGILGIIIGPIVAALFITLWEIYGNVFHAYLPEVGVAFQPLDEETMPVREGKSDEKGEGKQETG